jgi:hypothetical protein
VTDQTVFEVSEETHRRDALGKPVVIGECEVENIYVIPYSTASHPKDCRLILIEKRVV